MKFTQGASNALGADTDHNPTAVTAIDGRIFVSTTGGAADTGIYEFNFPQDTAAYYDTTDRSESNQPLSGRNGGSNTFNTSNQTAFALSNKYVNDLDVSTNKNHRYLAAATESGINLDDPYDDHKASLAQNASRARPNHD